MKKIALLHRYPADSIKETNAAFEYFRDKVDVLTFKTFDRLNNWKKFIKSFLWIFYAPFLVFGKNYDVIYCDDSFPFYPALVKLASPRSKIILRLGDLHLMYYTHGWVYRLLHNLEKISWNVADRIIVISQAMADRLRKEGYYAEVVLDSVDPKDFPLNNSAMSNMSNGVMFHGLLTKNKNVDILLEAAKLLPNIYFTIVGDGPDKHRLMGKAPSNVLFYGWTSFKNIHNHIARCAVGVSLRSDNPGNEFVVTSPFLQYGVMGKPCLVTRRHVFEDYEWQFSTAEEMAEKIQILLKRPEEGQRLRKYILENHDAKKIGDQIWNLLSAL